MSTLLQTLKDHQLTARKAKNTVVASLLTTLIGEAAMVGKDDGNRETTDAEATAVIKKFIKNIDETVKLTVDVIRADSLRAEKVILEAYLPQQLSENDLTMAILRSIATIDAPTPKDMGKVMKDLKDAFDGCYDGKAASAIVRIMLA